MYLSFEVGFFFAVIHFFEGCYFRVIKHQGFGAVDSLSMSLFTATDAHFFHKESKKLIEVGGTSEFILSFSQENVLF